MPYERLVGTALGAVVTIKLVEKGLEMLEPERRRKKTYRKKPKALSGSANDFLFGR